MRIADKKPDAVRSPVRITDEKYELWFCKPVLLGEINRIGGYWFTQDGMRFVSSRNALDYLATLRDLVEKEVLLDEKYKEKVRHKRSFAADEEKSRQGAATTRLRKANNVFPDSSTPEKEAPVHDIKQENLDRIIRALGYTRVGNSQEKTEK